MKLSSHLPDFLRKTAVQKSRFLNLIPSHHLATWVLVWEFPILLLSIASSYGGGAISFQDDSDGVFTSKWWIGPSWSLEPALKAVLSAKRSAAITASSQFVFSTILAWRELQTVMKSNNNPPTAKTTGPAILQLFKEAVLPTSIKTEPAMTKIRGDKRSSRLSLSLLVNLCIFGFSVMAGLKWSQLDVEKRLVVLLWENKYRMINLE